MRSAFWIGMLLATIVILLGSTATAAGRRRVGFPNQQAPAGAFNKQAAIGAYGRAVYPKYYWGIPAREYQNAGTPHGDQGIRGNTFQWQPW